MRGKANAVRQATSEIGRVLDAAADTMGDSTAAIDAITARSGEIHGDSGVVSERIAAMAQGITLSSTDLGSASRDILALLEVAERLMQIFAELGIETVDAPFIRLAQQTAARISSAFEAALAEGRIDEAALFDESYRPIPNTDPPQMMTRFVALTDALLPPIQEPLLAASERVVFCAAVDRNGFLPTHNRKYAQPQRPGDAAWNTANCRNRRLFNDRSVLPPGATPSRCCCRATAATWAAAFTR